MAVTKILTQLKTMNGYLAETEDIKDESANTSLKDTLDKLRNSLFFHGIIAQAGVVTDTVIPNQTPASLIVYSVAQKRFYITNTTPEEFAEGTIEALYTKWDNSLAYNQSDDKTSISRADKTFFCLDIRSTGLTGLYTYNDDTNSLEIIAGENIITKNNIANDAITSSKIKKEAVNLEHLSVVLQNLIGVIDGTGGMSLDPNKYVITDENGALSTTDLGGGNILNYYSPIILLDNDLNSLISADGMIVGLTGTMPADGDNSVVSDSMIISFGRKVDSNTTNYGIQIASCISNGKIYTRILYGGNWYPWNVIGGSGSNNSGNISLTANRIVITNGSGELAASSVPPTNLDKLTYLANVTSDINNQIVYLENAISDIEFDRSDIYEFEFEEFADVITRDSGYTNDVIYNDDVPAEYQGKGKLVNIKNDNVGIDYSNYNGYFAYRVKRTGNYDTSDIYYSFYLLFSNDDKGNSYEDYQFDANVNKTYYNKSEDKLYTWSSGVMVEYTELMSGNKLQLNSINENKLSEDITEKINLGSMLIFGGILTGTQMNNIEIKNYNYIQSVTDESPMYIYYYQKNTTSHGFFVAMSELSAVDAAGGIKAPAYILFNNSKMYNDYSAFEKGTYGTPFAREDQLFILKKESTIDGVEGDNRGVYRYIGITDDKSLTKVF